MTEVLFVANHLRPKDRELAQSLEAAIREAFRARVLPDLRVWIDGGTDPEGALTTVRLTIERPGKVSCMALSSDGPFRDRVRDLAEKAARLVEG